MIARHGLVWLIVSYSLLAWSLRIPLPLRSPSAFLAASRSQRHLARRELNQDSLQDGPKKGSDIHDPTSTFHSDRFSHDSERKDDSAISASSTKHRSGNGKKVKHRPGQHHKDDRPSKSTHANDDIRDRPSKSIHGEDDVRDHTSKSKDKNRNKKPKKEIEERRYLSSSPRVQPKREMSFWDYDRHTKRLGSFNPFMGMETGAQSSKTDTDTSPDPSYVDNEGTTGWSGALAAAEKAEQTWQNSVGKPHHISEIQAASIPEETIQPQMTKQSQASVIPDPEHKIQRQTLLSLGGLITFDFLDDGDMLDTASRDRRDGWTSSTLTPVPTITTPVAAWTQNISTYETPEVITSVLDGGARVYADKIIWQPASAHPDLSTDGPDLTKRRKHDEDEDEGRGRSDYSDSDYDDAEDRRGGKHSKSYDDDEEDEPKRGRKKHSSASDKYDDQDEDGGARNSRNKHKDEYEDDENGRSPSKGRKKTGFSEDDDDGYEYGSSRGSSRKYALDDADSYDSAGETPHRKRPGSASTSAMGLGNANSNDCAQLASFYRNMDGEYWTRDLGWKSAVRGRTSCCDWLGVTCDEYERVIGIRLSDVGLEGQMSTDLFSLDQLVRL